MQVSSLALCKLNKNQMLLRRMSSFWRHERVDSLFWDYDEVTPALNKDGKLCYSRISMHSSCEFEGSCNCCDPKVDLQHSQDPSVA